MEIMTRRQASELGLLTYNTGRLCSWGHEGIRRTSSGACVGCQNDFKINKPKKVYHQSPKLRKQLLAAGYVEKSYVLEERRVPFMDAVYGMTNRAVSEANLEMIKSLLQDYPRSQAVPGCLVFEPVIAHKDDIDIIRDVARELINARKIS